jgi:hypothetical protein
VAPEAATAPGRAQATATLEETPKAKAVKATEVTRVATRPQAPMATQATAETATDRAAKAKAMLETQARVA